MAFVRFAALALLCADLAGRVAWLRRHQEANARLAAVPHVAGLARHRLEPWLPSSCRMPVATDLLNGDKAPCWTQETL